MVANPPYINPFNFKQYDGDYSVMISLYVEYISVVANIISGIKGVF